MLSPTANTIGSLPSLRSAKVAEQLGKAFAETFSVWQRCGSRWQIAGSSQANGSAEELQRKVADWFNQIAAIAEDHPQVLSIGKEDAIVAVALTSEVGEREVIAGRVSLNATQLATSVAQFAIQYVESDEPSELLDHYATRLSASFEELCFLRRLSRHLEYCVANRSLSDAATIILPQLKELLDVEVVFLAEAFTEGEARPFRIKELIGSSTHESGVVEFWQEFIDQLDESATRVQVSNTPLEKWPHATALPDLRSMAIVPIERESLMHGWLIAMNKRLPQNLSGSPLNSLGHGEIGSMEMTLLEAAAAMLGSHAANNRLVKELEALLGDVIQTLVGVIEAKDAYTCGHSDRVAKVALRLAEQLGLPDQQCQDVYLAGLLHDIGKIGIPDGILLKPGRLTEEEFAEICKHPTAGVQMLERLRPLAKLIPGVLHHHEAVDGSGYPHRLAGDSIPLMARILAVADTFDALTSDRPYRQGMSLDKAEAILKEGAGKQWDAEVIKAYFDARDEIVQIATDRPSQLRPS